MTTSLARSEPGPIALQVFGEERIQVLKEQLGRGWKEPMTDAELEHIGLVCQRTRLDPLARPPQIYFIKRKDTKLGREVMTPQVSIDGLRLIASRTRQYLGQVGPQWCGPDGVWREVWLADDPPAAARVGVQRMGFKEPLWAVATWREWAQYENEWGGPTDSRRIVGRKLTQFWEAKPAHMLGKTAEGMALKRAFPEETNELELASLEEEQRALVAVNARRYDEIYGNDDTGPEAPWQRPRLGASAPVVETEQGQVDTGTGEVLTDARPMAGSPSRSELWDENRRLVVECQRRGLTGVPVLGNRSGENALAAANADLRARLEAHAREYGDGPPPEEYVL